VLDRLQQDVLRHVGHALDDDAAMLLLRREPALVPSGRGGVDRFGGAGSRGLIEASGVPDLAAADSSAHVRQAGGA
jgi:hypothetical protein